jgi:hypothetical protein
MVDLCSQSNVAPPKSIILILKELGVWISFFLPFCITVMYAILSLFWNKMFSNFKSVCGINKYNYIRRKKLEYYSINQLVCDKTTREVQ